MHKFLKGGVLFDISRAPSMPRVIAQAQSHFDFVGKLVDCQTVKAFLPLRADPRLRITIPTPITVHLDECEQCRKDYSALHALNLTSEALAKLAGLLTKPRLQYEDFAELANSGVLTANDTPEPADIGGFRSLDDKYADFPIKVQAKSKAKTIARILEFTRKVRERTAAVNWPGG